MTTNEVSIDIHDHGTAMDDKKSRVSCNYCSKVVSGFFRLKCHLGGIRGDVTPCQKVPENVREPLRNKLLEAKRDNLGKEVGELYHPGLPWKRNAYPNLDAVKRIKHESTQTPSSSDGRHVETDYLVESGATESSSPINKRMGIQTAINYEENVDPLSRKAQKSIARFFYATGIDFSVLNSPSFQRMINSTLGHGQVKYKVPTWQDLNGWILQDEVKEIQEYVKKIRHSWGNTGCSILLDGWVDENGQNLVNFLVECPEGPVYLRSSDVSAFIDDSDALQSFLDGVVDEIGADNVVQIIASSTMGWMGAVGKQFMDRRRTVLWTVSASHCIGLMLKKIGMMDSIRIILDKAKALLQFIYGHAEVLKLLRQYTSGSDLIKPSKIKSAMPFMSLENIVSEKSNLKNMFASSDWNTSVWAYRMEGKRIADLVGDPSFWTGAGAVLKATIPLVRALCLIDVADHPQVGYIYETMDQAKETIKEEFKNKKSLYMPYWKVIDEIWDTHLHSPLHAAGYYLNPCLFYSSDFYSDPEVSFGLLFCIVRLVHDQRSQDLISLQLDEYRNARGAFKEGSGIEQRTNIPPALWWSRYGKQYPELQKFAIRILSQTCTGASRYRLKRSLAEKVLTSGRDSVEQQQMINLAYVHYNLQLQESKVGIENAIMAEEIDPTDDWIADVVPGLASENGGSG